MLGEIALKVGALGQVDCVLPRRRCDLLHQRLAADAGDRSLPRRIDVGQEEQVGGGKASAELRAQELRPRVAMRLKYADEARWVRRTRRRQRHGDLRRMMSIVVHHPDTALLALRLEASLCPVEARERIPNLHKVDTRKPCDRNAGKRVEHIVPPRDIEGDTPHLRTALEHIEGDDGAVRLNIRRTIIRLRVDGIGNHASLRLCGDLPQDLIFKAEHRRPVLRHLIDECAERLDDLLHRAVVIHVIVLDVRHNGDVGTQLEEGAVALIRLGDKPAARAELRIRAEIGHLAADDDGRRHAHAVEGHADHGGRRRLAVRACDGDAVVLIDERRIDVRAMQLRDAQIPSSNNLRVVVGNCCGDDDGIRAAHILRTLSVRRHTRAEAYEFLDDG